MQHRSWGLALDSLDQVLEVPSDEDIPWIPDIESLLLRSRLRLITGDKKGLWVRIYTLGINWGFLQELMKMLSSLHRAKTRVEAEYQEHWFWKLRYVRCSFFRTCGWSSFKAMFATGDWEHALVIFHRVKRQTNGANKNAERGIQRCLEAINNSLDQIKQSQVNICSLFFMFGYV